MRSARTIRTCALAVTTTLGAALAGVDTALDPMAEADKAKAAAMLMHVWLTHS